MTVSDIGVTQWLISRRNYNEGLKFLFMIKFTEEQLIKKIQELKQIKPNNDWVVLTKKQIFESEKQKPFSFISFTLHLFSKSEGFIKEAQRGEKFVLRHKPTFAVLTAFVVLIGMFGFAQNSVPGDSLFTLRRITEQGQSVFVINEVEYNLGLVGKRLDDLEKIAQANEVGNLASAINEYQDSISKAAESLAKTEDLKIIVFEIKKLHEKEEKIKSYGIEIGDSQEINDVLYNIVAEEIESLEKREVTEEEQEVLNIIKESFKAGNYSEALENILLFND